jgi:hypothetical protein
MSRKCRLKRYSPKILILEILSLRTLFGGPIQFLTLYAWIGSLEMVAWSRLSTLCGCSHFPTSQDFFHSHFCSALTFPHPLELNDSCNHKRSHVHCVWTVTTLTLTTYNIYNSFCCIMLKSDGGFRN